MLFEQPSKLEKLSEKETKEEIFKEILDNGVVLGEYERFGATIEEIAVVPEDIKQQFIHYVDGQKSGDELCSSSLPADARGIEEIKEKLKDKIKEYSNIEIKGIKYTTPEGKSISLDEFLPEGWRIIRQHIGKLQVVFLTREGLLAKNIIYPQYYKIPESDKYFLPIQREGFFLGLLHEIGHAHFYESESLNPKRKNELNPTLKTKRETIKEERSAWAWALQTLRKLRREGIDFEPTLPENKKILEKVHAVLSTYEKKDLSLEEFKKAFETMWGRVGEDLKSDENITL